MKTTTHGYKVPDPEDKDFWDQIQFDIYRLDGHTHDGVDSEPLSPGAIEPYTELVQIADWVGASAPYYYDVIFPIGWDFIWISGQPCPVQVTVRNSSNDVVYLGQAIAPSGLGVRVYTMVKADYLVGMT